MKTRLATEICCDSIVDGPGLRMVIWLQGSYINKCYNPQTHNIYGVR